MDSIIEQLLNIYLNDTGYYTKEYEEKAKEFKNALAKIKSQEVHNEVSNLAGDLEAIAIKQTFYISFKSAFRLLIECIM